MISNVVSTRDIFKEPIICPRCGDSYLFTLRAIAELPKLECPGCHSGIDLRDNAVATEVRKRIMALEEH